MVALAATGAEIGEAGGRPEREPDEESHDGGGIDEIDGSHGPLLR
jgi:hypothetical protein